MDTRSISLYDRHGKVRAHAIVDVGDYEAVTRLSWYLTSARYARRTAPDGRKIYLHRELMGLTIGDPRLVDHINRNRLDNRRSNLRIVTKAQQQQNMSARRDGTSRYRGVYRKESGRWAAQARRNGVTVYIGVFDSQHAAACAAADFRRQHMPFSYETLPPAKPRDPMLSPRGGSSKYRGVVWSKNAKKWAAYVRCDGRHLHLGYFFDEAEAAAVAHSWREAHRPNK